MENSERSRAGLFATLGLAIPVATTVFYMATLGGPADPSYATVEAYFTERWSEVVAVWLTESVGFVICAIAAMGLAAQPKAERAAWNAIALGSLGGLLSTAIGIGFFSGFGTAGEANLPLFFSVVNGSFVFFFIGKALTGAGVLGVGLALLKTGGGIGKLLGLLAALSGLIALGANILATGAGLSMVMLGGATGIAATAVGAVAVFVLTRSPSAGD